MRVCVCLERKRDTERKRKGERKKERAEKWVYTCCVQITTTNSIRIIPAQSTASLHRGKAPPNNVGPDMTLNCI